MWSSILTLALASPASSATVVLDGIYSSFKTGGSPNDVVDRALFKMRDETHVELYRNGEVGQTTPILADSVHLSQSFDFHDGVLSGCDGCDGVTGTVQANGDIVWTHGYTSRKDAPSTNQLNKGWRAVFIVLSLIAVSLLTASVISVICKRRRARPLPVEVVGVQISAPSAGAYDMRPNTAAQQGKEAV